MKLLNLENLIMLLSRFSQILTQIKSRWDCKQTFLLYDLLQLTNSTKLHIREATARCTDAIGYNKKCVLRIPTIILHAKQNTK